MNKYLYVAFTLFFVSLTFAQTNPSADVEPKPTANQAENDVGGKPPVAEQEPPKVEPSKKSRGKVFRPTEEISEDLPVYFPVNI